MHRHEFLIENEEGDEYAVSVIDAVVMLSVAQNPDVTPRVNEVAERLQQVIAAL